MTWREIFVLRGTPAQIALAEEALNRCSFDWRLLRPGIDAQRGAGYMIPVEWSDLSRFAQRSARASELVHQHVHENGDTGHPIEFRQRVLGLAWYSLKISLDLSLERDPELAAEVLLAEGAHMIDFAYLTNSHRIAIWNALHPGQHEDLAPGVSVVDGVVLGSGEGWFDVGDYYSWIGEAWMGLFVKAYSDVTVQIDSFRRKPTPEGIAEVRAVIPPYAAPEPAPTFWGTKRGWTYHRGDVADLLHRWRRYFSWDTREAAVAAGRRPCRMCKP